MIEKPRAPRVSVVIVSLNREETLRESLAALGDEHQVIVVDNGSTDGSQQLDSEFPHARFSKLPKNFGLTKAMNIGVRAADGEFILFLHDDTRIEAAGVTALADYLEAHPDAGAVCPLLVGADGSPAPQTGSLLSPLNTDIQWAPAAGGDEIVAECVIGAAIMFRSSFLRALRQIDERYGTFGPMMELCAQVRRANKKIVILRAVTAVHEQLESPVKPAILEGDRVAGMAAYLGKHHGASAGFGYRLKTAPVALLTFQFKKLSGAVAGSKIDGTS